MVPAIQSNPGKSPRTVTSVRNLHKSVNLQLQDYRPDPLIFIKKSLYDSTDSVEFWINNGGGLPHLKVYS
jgi:hypothetical protein